MPNTEAQRSSVPVALLYQTSQLRGHLKEALQALGASVVYEGLTADLDRETLQSSGARVVVVNLDAETEAHIDHVYDLLDEGDFSVVFNDAQASASLQGWDQARWARHLAAKILKQPDIEQPPRPPGAEAVPTPVQKLVAAVPDFGGGEALPISEPEPEAEPVVLPDLVPLQTLPSFSSLVTEDASEDDFAAALESFASENHALPGSGESAPKPVDEFDFASSLESLDAAPESVPLSLIESEGPHNDFASELEALFAQTEEAPSHVAAPGQGADADRSIIQDEADAENNLWQLLPVYEEEEESPLPTPSTPTSNLGAVAPPILDDLKWQLQPMPEDGDPEVDELIITGSGVAPDKGSEDFLANFDSLDQAVAKVPVSNATKMFMEEPSAESDFPNDSVLPAPDWLLEPLTDDDTGLPSDPLPSVETISASEFLAPEVEQPGAGQHAVMPATFDLELMPLEEAIEPESQAYERETWLSDVAPKTDPVKKKGAAPAPALVNIRHVVVLCASIGGPEAVRDFVAALPMRFPALFVLAQHMSGEFMGLMADQLAKATQLTVHTPKHGERVTHGDILVVPTTHRLQVDAEGVVTLSPLVEATANTPSIDTVLRDMADGFGSKTSAIIFSGMAPDGVEGCQYLADKGGTIWAQDPSTCVISSMVDEVKEAGKVSFIGAPQQLAKKLVAEAKNWK